MNNTSMILVDPHIVALVGFQAAYIFERLWFFAESVQCEYPQSLDNIRYKDLLDKMEHKASGVNPVPSMATFRRSLDALRKLGLLTATRSQYGMEWSVNLDNLKAITETTTWQRYAALSRGLNQNDQIEQSENVQIEQSEPERQSRMLTLSTQNAHIEQSLLYIDKYNDESIPEANASGAQAPAEPGPPVEEKSVNKWDVIWGAWATLTNPGKESWTASESKAIGAAASKMKADYSEDALFDALNTGRFHAWLVLTDDWFIEGKVSKPHQLQGSFKRMMSHEIKNGLDWFRQFEAKFPNWREQVQGHCTTFARVARDLVPVTKKSTGKGHALPAWNQGHRPDPASKLDEIDLFENEQWRQYYAQPEAERPKLAVAFREINQRVAERRAASA